MTQPPPGPLFSVVVPTYNRPRELEGCLSALRAQRSEDFHFEVLIVDDGGSVDLQSVLNAEGGSLDVRLVRQKNAGPGHARNTGAARACGRFLAFTDDDCRPDPAWLLELKHAFAIDPEAMIGGKTINLLERNLYATTSQLLMELVYDFYNPDPDHASFFASNNMAFPADAFRACGGFTPSFRVGAEDRELCDRWLAQGRRLRFAPGAVIRHAHDLTLLGFLKQHFNYGRGASRYHRLRKLRETGRMSDDLTFHRNLPGAVKRRLQGIRLGMKLKLLALFFLWQLANAWGFFYEEIRTLCGKGEPLKSHQTF